MDKKIKATLKDVANLAGVSTATVSNVTNNTKFVSEDVKRKVLDAMKTLNYRPNTLAKSLRVQETKLIGVLISDITNPFFSKVVRGIEYEANKNGYNILLCNTESNAEKEQEYLDILIGKRIDGLIISSSGNKEEYIKHLESANIPIVFLNRSPESALMKTVMTNNIRGSYLAAEHLINHGYEKISIISGPQTYSTGRDRLIGYKRAMEDYGLQIDEKLIKIGNFDIESGYQLMKELINSGEKVDACFIANNSMTLGAYKYLKETNLKIGTNLAIVGYDESDWADIVEPPLSTISQPAYEQGTQAAELVIANINGKELTNQKVIYLEPKMIIRESCGCKNE
ncbi:LacI family DNA-binding transcriptional regulator [Bacillus sp. V2I10]|uniref:LacI family DNA-binding transcriptional regulator n=1 Tax=Bacillus sp. V2I10 TaxID=3042276 RepID=UPI002780F6AC|nr:LacI family DNA-binding transcriptional regulator [Bacillus sp. V2I10]MDQ0859530.1 LacI family transcriptional regulator [Bacillus sp. V2I10]